jgi:DNA repair exonuclease SbcCD ATPase subunit
LANYAGTNAANIKGLLRIYDTTFFPDRCEKVHHCTVEAAIATVEYWELFKKDEHQLIKEILLWELQVSSFDQVPPADRSKQLNDVVKRINMNRPHYRAFVKCVKNYNEDKREKRLRLGEQKGTFVTMATHNRKIGHLHWRNNCLQNQLGNQVRITNGLGQQVRDLEQHKSVLEQHVGDLQQRNGVLEQEVGDLRQQVGGLQQRNGDLEQQVEGLQQRNDVLEQQVEGLQQRNDVLEQQVEGLQQRNGVLEQEVGDLRQQVGCLQQRNDVLEHQAVDLKNEVREFKREVRELKEGNATLIAQNATIIAENATLNTVVSKLEARIEETNNRFMELVALVASGSRVTTGGPLHD